MAVVEDDWNDGERPQAIDFRPVFHGVIVERASLTAEDGPEGISQKLKFGKLKVEIKVRAKREAELSVYPAVAGSAEWLRQS